MNEIITQIIIGLIASIIGGLIVQFLIGKRIVSLATFLVLLIGTGSLIWIFSWPKPTYEVTGVQGQIDNTGSTWISGRLLEKKTGAPVAGQVIQIKIFEAGSKDPSKGPSFPTTNINGNFTVNFPLPSLKQNTLYVINTAYKYDNKWEIKDFNVAFSPPPTQTSTQPVSLFISEPQNGQRVSLNEWVRGRISDTSYDVYVLIHPMATSSWWVQPLPNLHHDGTWEAYCFFGEERVGIGESFEIMAIAIRERGIFRRGQQISLDGIPRNAVRSSIIRVIRQ